MPADSRFARAYALVAALCFLVLGGLTGRRVGPEVLTIAAWAVGGAVLAAAGLVAMGVVLTLFGRAVRREHGRDALSYAVARGFLMLIPFTVLATLAELVLGWSAVQAFTSAGIMAAGAGVGIEFAKLGGGRLTGMVAPTAVAFLISAAWMLLSAAAQGIGRG